jgi:pyruvate/2-oxoglutarate dehydrogenase complex dihydrolipoamide acyltransferase (E2) component
MTRLRQTIARRLKDAQNTAAMLTTYNEVDMSAVMKMRSDYKELFEKKHGVKLGFMGFFSRACIQALKEIPEVNAEIDGTDLVYKNYYHIGVAVGTERGLVVPVVRDADQLSLAGIEKAIGALGKKARDGRLADVDADPECAAVRHSRHAQDSGAPGRDRRQDRNSAYDVSRAHLRSSRGRWTGCGHLPRAGQGKP